MALRTPFKKHYSRLLSETLKGPRKCLLWGSLAFLLWTKSDSPGKTRLLWRDGNSVPCPARISKNMTERKRSEAVISIYYLIVACVFLLASIHPVLSVYHFSALNFTTPTYPQTPSTHVLAIILLYLPRILSLSSFLSPKI